MIGDVHGRDKDPQAERVEKNKEGQTFGELFEDWYARHAEIDARPRRDGSHDLPLPYRARLRPHAIDGHEAD